MFIVEVTRKGTIRKTPFTNRAHAQRFADNIRAMPRHRQPDRIELRAATDDDYMSSEDKARGDARPRQPPGAGS